METFSFLRKDEPKSRCEESERGWRVPLNRSVHEDHERVEAGIQLLSGLSPPGKEENQSFLRKAWGMDRVIYRNFVRCPNNKRVLLHITQYG